MQRNTSLQSTSHQEGQQPSAHNPGQHQQQQQRVHSQPQAGQSQVCHNARYNISAYVNSVHIRWRLILAGGFQQSPHTSHNAWSRR